MADLTRRARHHNPLDFRPPRPNRFIQGMMKGVLPWVFKQLYHDLSVQMDAASFQNLQSIQGERCLILPNHPTEWDPGVLFEVAKRLHENFYFVAAREVFDFDHGLCGWLFQRLGVYSLVRGSQDLKSLKTSIDILSRNKGRLVIFIEGEISNQNETLLPLEAGVIQLAFMALNDLYKHHEKQLDNVPPLFLCPMGLHYVYHPTGLDKTIEESLLSLESATGCSPLNETHGLLSRYERFQQLSLKVLSRAGQQSGLAYDPNQSIADNVYRLSDFMLGKLEGLINLPSDPGWSHLERIRQIRNVMDKILTQSEEEAHTPYEKRLFLHQKSILKNFYADLDRLVNFIAIYDGYLQPDMDAGRSVALIRRLEKEVFGHVRLAHPRTVHITVPPPIDLNSYFPAFLANKRDTIASLSNTIEQQIYQAIFNLSQAKRPGGRQTV